MNHTKGTAMESKESAQLAQRIQDHFHATLGPLYLPERIDRERVYESVGMATYEGFPIWFNKPESHNPK